MASHIALLSLTGKNNVEKGTMHMPLYNTPTTHTFINYFQHIQLGTLTNTSCGECELRRNAAASHKASDALKLKTICTQCLLKTKFNSSTAFVPTVQPRATELLYSVRAPPAPTPSVEPSPPIEISTGGLISEHFARACNNTTAQQYQWSNSWTNS